MSKTVLLAAALIGLAACEKPLIDDQAKYDPGAESISRPLGRMEFVGAENYRGDSEEARAARIRLLDSVMGRYERIRMVMTGGFDWTRIEKAVAKELSSPEVSEAESWFLDQMSATVVLEAMLGETPGGKRESSAVRTNSAFAATCIELLLKRQSPNAPLLARALAELRGYWPGDRIAESATRASQIALAWLEDECGACAGPYSPAMPNDEHWRIEILDIKQGIGDLVALSVTR
ncbi:MAG: hypothetical protein HKN37_02570 [Rhodothermales bacterium]|nr:hypothetical protein [Rhodothermales bacterium]